MTRLRNLLVMVVALFVLGASSQAAVCELACGQVAAMQCNAPAAGHSEAMVMSHGHCSHAMASMQGVTQSVGGLRAADCGHASVLVFAKGGSSFVSFSAVRWVLVGVVPVDRVLTGGDVGVGGRPPLVPVGVDPLVVSRRV
jgi:hypothetical protein